MCVLAGEFVVLIDGEEHAISSEVNADGGLKVVDRCPCLRSLQSDIALMYLSHFA